MRTPKEYTKDLQNHIITAQMLSDCLYSCNKRAKNWRDKESYYRSMRYDTYHNEENAREEKAAGITFAMEESPIGTGTGIAEKSEIAE